MKSDRIFVVLLGSACSVWGLAWLLGVLNTGFPGQAVVILGAFPSLEPQSTHGSTPGLIWLHLTQRQTCPAMPQSLCSRSHSVGYGAPSIFRILASQLY